MNDSNQAPATPTQQGPTSYKDMIEAAYNLSKDTQRNVIRLTLIIEDLVNQISDTQSKLSEVGKQLVAIYKLSEEGKALTSENVATYIVTRESEILKKTISDLVDAGKLVSQSTIQNDSDIVAYSTADVSFGYMSLLGFSPDDQQALKGKAVGDTVGAYKVEGIYQEAPASAQSQTQGETDESQEKTEAAQ